MNVEVKRKPVYTTAEVARLMKVATATVVRWFDSGLLRGYRVPGSLHRRIPHDLLLAFCREHQLPTEDLE